MKSAILRSLVGVVLLSYLLHADVTMRSKMDYRLGSFVPAAAAEGMNKQMGEMLANGVVLRIKGKRSLTQSGPLITITDGDKGTITLIDPKGKRFATIAIADYGDKLKAAMPEVPEAAKQMLANMKLDVKTDRTGKTDTIKGIKAEEMLIVMTVDMPGPMGAAMGMTMEMHLWAATKEELERVPALKEIAAYMANQAAGTDPSSTAAKMFGQIPGFADKLKGPMDQLIKSSSQAVLRSEMKMIMPGSAKMMGATNPDEPFTQITTDLSELSTEPIPDSVFQVPAGYQEGKIEELVQAMNPMKQGQGQQQQPPPPPAPAPIPMAAGAAPEGVSRVGGGVTAPRLIRKIEPSYTEEDRQAKVQGTVRLYVQVNPQGKADHIRVLQSLSPGLDQKAIEAVEQWEFQPGTKEGRPVTVESQIEVNFRLLDKKDADAAAMAAVQPVARTGALPAPLGAPVLIRKVEPEYTEEARAAKFQGTVTLTAVISTEGVPQDLRVVRSLGMGLDEKAIEAVKKWQFRPGTKDGNPVAMMSTIEVNFRLGAR